MNPVPPIRPPVPAGWPFPPVNHDMNKALRENMRKQRKAKAQALKKIEDAPL